MPFYHLIMPRHRGVCIPLLAAIFVLCANALGQFDPLVVPETNAEPACLLSPTLGRPVFTSPGGSLQIVARIPNARAPISLELVSTRRPSLRYQLTTNEETTARMASGQAVLAAVPANAAAQTYDLLISCGARRLRGRHCVAVGEFDRALRIVHLSNMNIGGMGAPTFDQRLIGEINLIAPTLIVATGDYLDVTHPDIEAGWQSLVDFLCGFDAPAVLACGDHDNIDLYSRHAAPSPVGLVQVGRHRGLIMYDLPRAPIYDNPEQIRWIERMLGQPGFDGVTFVVTHDDSPNLLEHWRRQGTLTEMLNNGRIGLWFVAGHRDWRGRDYRDIVESALPMVYLRTHQSSRTPRGGASGISHYRIVDIAGDRVTSPQAWQDRLVPPPSTPVGRLSVKFDGPNDGARSTLLLTAANNHPYRLEQLSTIVRLHKNLEYRPWLRGVELTAITDCDEFWECRVRFNLPDKGILRAKLGSGPPPPKNTLDITFDVADQLPFRRTNSPRGLTYYCLQGAPPIVRIRNFGEKPASVSPLIRFDGDLIAYQPLERREGYATAYRLLVMPGETIGLQVDLSAVRVAPGRRDLQVYLDAAQADELHSRTVNVVEAK